MGEAGGEAGGKAGSNAGSNGNFEAGHALLFDFWRPITLLSPKNMPGTHQYAVTLVAQIVAQIFGLFWRSLLVDKVSWYMRFFLILPNK